MMNSEPDSSHRLDILRDVLHQIETLRIKRQQEARDRPHPLLKRFSQQELADEACPTYRNLLEGRSRRVPNQTMIMQIAQYLECSAQERNNLLLAARYLPENLELEGIALKQALEQAQQVMGMLPYPAIIVTHTLSVHAANNAFQRVFEIPPLEALQKQQRHLFYFLFHRDFPMRARSTFNDQARDVWHVQASLGIDLFKHSNILYQFEPWYQQLIEQFSTLSDFRAYWGQESQEQEGKPLPQKNTPSKIVLSRNAETSELLPIQLRQIYISVCSHKYPCIAAFLPLDEAARVVFASLGSAKESSEHLSPYPVSHM
ncbi:hypothetical protein KDA_73910 [Dictyobacter alpinus]|uniref:MmyB-like transcription regulator ligand binding domain-containing protein n=1 Tax=Dictyobacter alpinus TaxID=2014873 RepID=A0A402BKL4_9CHLR|nr:hypothetical protein [Dictyobacter alpinus]GCE31907.1 hypothetical protein KDA_73910 [Dictyobacter alpinus]